MSVFTHPDGTPITKLSNFCGRCVKAPQTNYENSISKLAEAQKVKQLPGMKISYNCVIEGLWSEGVAVNVQGKHLATWLIGNIANLKINERQQIACAKTWGISHQELLQEIAEVPVLSEVEFNRIKTMFIGFVNGIAANAQKDLLIMKLLAEQKIAHELLKKNEERYQTMLDTLYEGIIVVQDGLLQFCNPRIMEMTGCKLDELLGHSILEFIHPDDREMVLKNYKLRVQGIELPQWYTFRLLNKGSDFLWIEISGRKIEWNGKGATINTFIEVTDRKKLTDDLKESEEKFRLIAENTSDGILSLDAEGKMIYASPSYFKHFSGKIGSNISSETIYENIHPEDRDEVFKNIFEAIKLKKQFLTYTYRAKSAENKYIWREDNANFSYDQQGNNLSSYVICRDITERKIAENEKNELEMMRQLCKYTEKARADERLAISRDLHDDIGQLLTAIKFDLALTKKRITDSKTSSQITAIDAYVDNTIKTVQRLTSELRPDIIENVDIVEALKLWSNDFMARYGIEILLRVDDKIKVSKEASSVVFRIFQESLTNIARHAKASAVDVLFIKMLDSFELRISDNGIGISKAEIESKTAYGLMGMKERAASIGGSVEITKKKSEGTIVKLVFKAENEQKIVEIWERKEY